MMFTDYPNLIKLLERTVARYGDSPALRIEGRTISYFEFWNLAEKFAAGLLSRNVQPGDRVAILLPNIPEFVISYYGALMAGAVVVPINNQFKYQEIQFILEDSECKFVVFTENLQNEITGVLDQQEPHVTAIIFKKSDSGDFINWDDFLLQQSSAVPIHRVDPGKPAVILYTSGTTGRPRGVVLSHRNLSSNALACEEAGGVTSHDVCLGVLPFYHSFGQTAVMNNCITSGALNVMMPKFEPRDVLRTLRENKITIFAAVPTMFKMLLDYQREPTRISSIRICLSGGAKLDVNVYHEFKEKFGLHIYEGYGLTEAAPVVSFNPMDYRSKVGSVGLPLSGIKVKIVDEEDNELAPGHAGEIVIEGPNVMQGYLNRPEATKEVLRDGKLYTGDIATFDDDGYIFILDRKGDLIIKGGFNVYPKEVEQVIAYHPKVKEVAIIGVPDPVQGEEVKAYISLKPGKRVSKKEIFEYCKEHLANYKCPKYITFLRTLPKSADGKILKRKLYIQKSK